MLVFAGTVFFDGETRQGSAVAQEDVGTSVHEVNSGASVLLTCMGRMCAASP